MKRNIIIMLLLCLTQTAKAQTFDEWFRQKKTRLKYLAEQIAALKVYGSYLEKGYDISKQGLGAIRGIKNGDFGQHAFYFNSLKAVSPQVAGYPVIEATTLMQHDIQRVVSKAKDVAASAGVFTESELEYIHQVFERLNTDCLSTLQELGDVTTPGKLEMKDDERIKYIDRLYGETKSQYGFARSFSNSISLMAIEKKKDGSDIETIDTWYGIKKD